MNDVEKANSILDAIEIIFNNHSVKLPFDTTKKAVVSTVNGDGTIDITVNDITYEDIIIHPALTLNAGDVVLVVKPNNQWKNAYAILKL